MNATEIEIEPDLNEKKEVDGTTIHFLSATVPIEGDDAKVTLRGLNLGTDRPTLCFCQPRLDDGAVSRRATDIFATTVLATTAASITFALRRIPRPDGVGARPREVRCDVMAAE